MKFIGIILLLLTSIFLIACSANQASNNASNSELENLASKYGGVYVFNQKFVEEIEKREAERKELRKNTKGKYLGDGLYVVNTKLVDEKLPQTLSNGKQYYTPSRSYEKKPELSNQDRQKIINYIGTENYNKFKPTMLPSYFYVDENNNVVAIAVSVYYAVGYTKYGLFGDEGRGFSLSRKDIKDIGGNSEFYFDSHKNTFVREK
ncbi:tRNA 2-selenouridine synthase [Campylobacter concisus]|uniref:tRNA 2-selenouridine synthase n=1 Tax=Campylobacter concisus TaxID=199 RepID=A0A7S9RUZ2_9BACT|nr:tRNA 2-selenouridine synthase [Campylobacter concisus]QPH98350.1 tRNA 2-selenouridine synthase [Campylobacter concisus]QPI05535.1 tRNA 2-selenouridine synthase [Campylobacter concisus]